MLYSLYEDAVAFIYKNTSISDILPFLAAVFLKDAASRLREENLRHAI
jgi:hypothetical protein